MNSKSRYFSSLLIAIVAAFGYYILTDFNISDIQLKTFSSLGIPFKMYQTNNSVKQKKLPLPKVVYSYANQQDVLKAPKVDLIVESESDAAEFLAGLTGALLDAERKTKERQPNTSKINDKYKYGSDDENYDMVPDVSVNSSHPVVTTNGKTPCPTMKVQEKITSEDIQMFVTTVATQNVKKIEECFKKIKVIYGNDNSLKNIIVTGTQKVNKDTRGSVVNSTTTIKETRRMLKASPVDIDVEEAEMEQAETEDTEN